MALLLGAPGCGAPRAVAPVSPVAPAVASGTTASAPPPRAAPPFEPRLDEIRQLTFGGQNAEAYWSPDGAQLVFQARPADAGCDRIYRLVVPATGSAPAPATSPEPIPVSSGAGVTTCGFFLPGTSDLVFSSTHLAGAECPPRPDRSHGYTWALYPSYDIFRAGIDGTHLRRLTDAAGYDAEATVCPVDGSIVFTSVRDGDLDLYRMDPDGSHVRRLTHDIGYDGGAFFDGDCSHIVWRASRPAPGPERDEYQSLLRQGLVRPSKLEIWVAASDGSNAAQVTYLDAASFAPSFFPGRLSERPRIIFSSNVGDPRGREFELWAVDASGANLERVTSSPGFDGFPMFSPDGTRLAFSSNRATALGKHDTNVFVARWQAGPARPPHEPSSADRILADIAWLAAPERGGRGVGTPGLAESGAFVEARLRETGLAPAGEDGGFRQPFQVPTDVTINPGTKVALGGIRFASDDFRVASFSAAGKARGPLVLAGYGIVDPERQLDDYSGLDVRGKLVAVRRFAPDTGASAPGSDALRRAGDVRRKAFVARERGAIGLVVVDAPARPPPGGVSAPGSWRMPDEAPFPSTHADGAGDAGIPVVFVRRARFAPVLARLEREAPRGAPSPSVPASIDVSLTVGRTAAFNVLARIPAGVPAQERLPGVVVIGAHYDHLGLGERHSLDPDSHRPHLGADDNASGTATLIEAARFLMGRRASLRRDVVVAAFSGEEEGTLGSTAFTRAPPPPLALGDVVAMVNLDMVGRMRDNRVTILGRGSADEWPALVEAACAGARIDCVGAAGGSEGFGPSDQMSFAAAGLPVAHFFTGNHPDYHRPSDSVEKINAAGAGQIAVAAAALIESVANHPARLTARRLASSGPGEGDIRSFGASLGSIPDYSGPADGSPGVLLAGVRAGGAAELGGLARGDILVRLGSHDIRSVEDLMYALGASKPGETVTAVVKRAGRELRLPVTFQASARPSDHARRPPSP